MKSTVTTCVTLALILLVGSVVTAWGQRPGGTGGGQRRMSGQRQMGQPQSMRVLVTGEQQKHYQACVEAMNRVRNRIRQMSRLAVSSTVNLQQMQALEERLRSELLIMEQEEAQFTDSLSTEQKTELQKRLADIASETKDLNFFIDALGFELDQATIDRHKVREDVIKLDSGSKELQSQQRDLGSVLETD